MKKCIILIVMVLAFAASSHAQSVAKAKAMLTLNFIRYGVTLHGRVTS